MPEELSRMLRQIRRAKGLSIRQVERDTEISNAYLSQLETGNALSPSPEILHKLAVFYSFPYEKLMEAAGYLRANSDGTGLSKLHERLQTALMSAALSEEDELRVAEFVEFLGTKRGLK